MACSQCARSRGASCRPFPTPLCGRIPLATQGRLLLVSPAQLVIRGPPEGGRRGQSLKQGLAARPTEHPFHEGGTVDIAGQGQHAELTAAAAASVQRMGSLQDWNGEAGGSTSFARAIVGC